jgi:hypothetical protein
MSTECRYVGVDVRRGTVLNSTVLDVALGMVFCWGAVALIASSVYEAIASVLKLRAKGLLTGVKALLNDPGFTGLAKSLYNSALVSPRDRGDVATERQLKAKPSYIDPQHFAAALIDVLQGTEPEALGQVGPGQQAPGERVPALKTGIDAIPDDQIKELLQGMYVRAAGKVENVQKEVASWFDSGMQRVSGVYKRKAQLFSFLIALAVAGVFNINTFFLSSALWAHPLGVAGLTVPHDSVASLNQLQKLPVGWTCNPARGPLMVFGWLATACSALFGAPFWFGFLQRLVNLRGTGPKPGIDQR